MLCPIVSTPTVINAREPAPARSCLKRMCAKRRPVPKKTRSSAWNVCQSLLVGSNQELSAFDVVLCTLSSLLLLYAILDTDMGYPLAVRSLNVVQIRVVYFRRAMRCPRALLAGTSLYSRSTVCLTKAPGLLCLSAKHPNGFTAFLSHPHTLMPTLGNG